MIDTQHLSLSLSRAGTEMMHASPTAQEIQAQVWARRFQALTSPVRMRIVSCLLASGGTTRVQDLVTMLALRQPTVSHHLRILQNADILFPRKQGLYCYYQVRKDVLGEVVGALGKMFAPDGVQIREEVSGAPVQIAERASL